MSITDAKILLPVIKGFCEGKKVAFQAYGEKRWIETENPSFTPCLKWKLV